MITTTSSSVKTVSLIVPARNEARNIGWVLERLPAEVDEVILVDGNSVDDTIEVARRAYPEIVVVRQARRGKGNALAAGFEAATGDLIVMIDADGSMDPQEIPAFLAPLAAGAHYAKGSRFTAGGGSDDITVLRRLGNAFLNGTTNLAFRSRFSDLCYGYNAFTRECVEVFDLPSATAPGAPVWGDGFEIETLINIRVARSGAVVREVPSYEYERRFGESNLHTFRDGFRVLRTIMLERMAPVRRRIATQRPVAAPEYRQTRADELA